MNYKIYLDLARLDSVYTQLSTDFDIFFSNITNLENWHNDEENVTELNLAKTGNNAAIFVYLNDEQLPDYDVHDGDFNTLSLDNTGWISFNCEITNLTLLLELINLKVV